MTEQKEQQSPSAPEAPVERPASVLPLAPAEKPASRMPSRRTMIAGIVVIVVLIVGLVAFAVVRNKKDTGEQAVKVHVGQDETTDKVIEKSTQEAETATTPDDKVLAYLNAGGLLESQGKYKEALEVYKKAEAIKPNDMSVLSNIAHAYYMLKDKDNTVTYYQRAIDIAKKDDTFKGNVEVWTKTIDQAKAGNFSADSGFHDDGFKYN